MISDMYRYIRCSQVMQCSQHTMLLNQLELLYVTQQSHTPQCPVVWVGHMGRVVWSFEAHCCDICEVRSSGLLVNWAGVEFGVSLVVICIDSIEVYHWQRREQHFGHGLC